MSDTGWVGDPYHEGSSQPMAHLKGGMESAPTQMPMNSTAMDNPRSAGTDNVQQTWDTTSLGASAGVTGNNDKAEAH